METGIGDKLPPHDIDAEEAVIGSILIDGAAVREVVEFLKPADFYSERCGLIYGAVLTLYHRRVSADQVTVAEELARLERLELTGGGAFLSHVISIVPTSLDIEHYAEIVKRLSTSRQLMIASSKINQLGQQADSDIGASLEKAREILDGVRFGSVRLEDEVVTPTQAGQNILDMVDAMGRGEVVKAAWGFDILDEITTGIYPGEYIVIGARPSVGKSELIFEVMGNLTKAGKIGLLASLEMPLNPIQHREIVMNTSVSMMQLRQMTVPDDKWGEIQNWAGLVSKRPLYCLTEQVTTDQIIRVANMIKETVGLDFIMVDYIQMLKDCRGTQNAHQALSNASRQLKGLAADLDVTVIVVSQINRGVEARENKRPMLSDLRESGSLEEDGDVVLLLYRDEVCYTVNDWESKYPGKDYPKGVLEIKQAKHRQLGITPMVRLLWDSHRRRYGPYSDHLFRVYLKRWQAELEAERLEEGAGKEKLKPHLM